MGPLICQAYVHSICAVHHWTGLFSHDDFADVDIRVQYLSRLVGKSTMWFPNRSDTNRSVQA